MFLATQWSGMYGKKFNNAHLKFVAIAKFQIFRTSCSVGLINDIFLKDSVNNWLLKDDKTIKNCDKNFITQK